MKTGAGLNPYGHAVPNGCREPCEPYRSALTRA